MIKLSTMGTPTLFVLLLSTLTAVLSESIDSTTIFRIHQKELFHHGIQPPDSPTASIAAHMRTNALGKILRARNGSYLEPLSAMPQFQCVPVVPDCTWAQIDNWSLKGQDLTNMLHQFELTPADSSCHIKNGGCQVQCETWEGAPRCKCPPRYSLNSDKKTCSGDTANNYILTGSSGTFKSPNHPHSYSNGQYVTWLIAAPLQHIITLNIQSFKTEARYDFMRIYDGPDTSSSTIGSFSGTDYVFQLKSRGNMMLITFQSDGSNVYSGFSATYSMEFLGDNVLTLLSNSGSLRSLPFVPKSPKICVSIIYKLGPSGELWVSANMRHSGSVNLTRSDIDEAGGWHIGRFTGTLPPEELSKSIMLSAHFNGMDSSVFSISRCNPFDDEDIYILEDIIPLSDLPAPEIMPQIASVTPQKCYNGGTYISKTKDCSCPAGFMGPDCREGCGPNYYGGDCKGICSGFKRGCHKMIFCKKDLPCMCAPGFTGRLCDIKCNHGHYGASCRMPCGSCHSGACNIYTGECETGCKPGYHPPLCQDTYLTLSEAPRIEYIDSTTALFIARGSSVVGRGSVKFYQVQYKEKDSSDWLELQPQEPVGGTIIANLTNLKSGIRHVIRVILINSDGNSNQNIGVPATEFQTLCSVPTSSEYHLKSDKLTPSSFEVSWKYNDLSHTSCPLKGFEVIFRDRWEVTKFNLSAENKVDFRGLLPGRTYSIALKALTEFGPAPLSSELTVTTQDDAPGEVTHLQAASRGPGELLVTWNKPRFSGGTIQRYLVEYECLRLLACNLSCNYSTGQVEVSDTSLVLTGLHPHAQYRIKVAGLSANLGPPKTILIATQHTGAGIAPDNSLTPITQRTNTSVTVQWAPPSNCSWLNGYLYSYRYLLVTKTGSTEHILSSGSTQEASMKFSNLTPHTEYEARVFAVTSGGWSAKHGLVISIMTAATAPEQVQNLTAYKKGRRLIGVRWAAPLQSYGPIKNFRVAYHRKDRETDREVIETVNPVPCTAWPHLHCHTIEGLIPDTQYVITVQARNIEVDTDGAPASITAITRERGPGAPVSLQVLQRTQTTMIVQWGLPFMINGVLRSFLVNVEETDSRDPSTCCDHFPIQELPVRTEEDLYRLEVGGLNPASTLTISVSAKTVTMGPAVNITTSTPPEPPSAVHPPELQPKASEDELYSVSILPTNIPSGIQGTYLLMILPPEDRPDPSIRDEDLLNQLQVAVNATFYIVAEFKSESLVEEDEITIGTGAPLRNGTLGALEDPVLLPGSYRVGLALILDYCGAKSVGFAASNVFEVTKCIGEEPCSVSAE